MVFASIIVGFTVAAHARTFLRAEGEQPAGETMSVEQLRTSLLQEIENSFGNGNHRGRVARLEAALYPTFASLPKNEFGNIGHATVRYALHRLFVQRHGWYVKGLEPGGDHWNSSSPAEVLKERVSSFVQEMFEERLGGHGFGLHETAVLAATIEHLIHDEARERLTRAYMGAKISQSEELNKDASEVVLDAYLKRYLIPEAFADKISDDELKTIYPGWTETSAFARDVREEFAHSKRLQDFSFDNMTSVVEEVGERFGRFQDSECRAMKSRLMALGDQGVGRVKLSDFYRAALHDNSFEFQESSDYLRQLGALDETNPSAPSVLIPNYITSQTNCIASSSLYSVCCLDECETLLGHIEKELAKPEALPKEILGIVGDLPSSTQEAPWEISSLLVTRLNEIAVVGNGKINIHGRLFAQWMHHAYPRECPYPHVSGATNPRSPDEWMEERGAEPVASEHEMRQHVSVSVDGDVGDGVATANAIALNSWSFEEELLMPAKKVHRSGWSFLRTVAFLAALACFALTAKSHAAAAISAIGLPSSDMKQSSLLPFDNRDTLRARTKQYSA